MGIHMEIRELIFRGFHPCDGPDTIVVDGEKVKGRWVEGSLVYVPNETDFMFGAYITPRLNSAQLDPERKSFMLGGFFEVLPSTVGQYTGLRDKNGKKIFEGDIFLHPNNPKRIYAVYWEEEGGFGIFMSDCGFNNEEIEVIGTVFDEVTP